MAKVEDERGGVMRSVSEGGSERIMVQARRLGASGLFAAPVDVDVLQGAIRAAMSEEVGELIFSPPRALRAGP